MKSVKKSLKLGFKPVSEEMSTEEVENNKLYNLILDELLEDENGIYYLPLEDTETGVSYFYSLNENEGELFDFELLV